MTLPMPDLRTCMVPADRLVPSTRNVRRTQRDRNLAALADSILRLGVLQNLVVYADGELFAVDAGERRRRAIALLVERGAVPPDWPVPVRLIEAADGTAASLSENVQREAMHPADQVAAFHTLTDEGWTVDRIADAFGVTPLVVERRLALARAAPELLELLRRDELTTEQLTALCATEDHERQLETWTRAPTWNRSPASLRRAVLEGEVDTRTDARVAFVGGTDAFVAAGGEIRPDLFSADGDGGFLTDVALLEALVAGRLQDAADAVRAEGWDWVEVWPDWRHGEFFRLGRIHAATELGEEAAARVGALLEEHARLAAEEEQVVTSLDDDDADADDGPDGLDVLVARMREIEDEIKAIEAAHRVFDPAAMAAAGAVVGRDGAKLRIERGLVRAADRPRVAEALGSEGAVSAGRETEVGGRRRGELSDTLLRSLLGHRNLAVQTATAAHPRIARVLLACWIVQALRFRPHDAPLDLRIPETGSGTRTQHPIVDGGGEVRRADFEAIGAALTGDLPREGEALWDAVAAMPDAELDRVIAFGVASAVSLGREHAGMTARLLAALDFDMADHFTTTEANYLGRVPKTGIVAALEEAGKIRDDAERAALLGLRKDDLAARAAADLAEARWVPAPIRTPRARPEPQATPAGRKGKTKPARPTAPGARRSGTRSGKPKAAPGGASGEATPARKAA